MFQHPDALAPGMLRSLHQHQNGGRMRARARSAVSSAKHELPVAVKRLESVLREIGVRAIGRKTGVSHAFTIFFRVDAVSARLEWVLARPSVACRPARHAGGAFTRAMRKRYSSSFFNASSFGRAIGNPPVELTYLSMIARGLTSR